MKSFSPKKKLALFAAAVIVAMGGIQQSKGQTYTLSPGNGTTTVTDAFYYANAPYNYVTSTTTVDWNFDINAGNSSSDQIASTGNAYYFQAGATWNISLNIIGTPPPAGGTETYTIFTSSGDSFAIAATPNITIANNPPLSTGVTIGTVTYLNGMPLTVQVIYPASSSCTPATITTQPTNEVVKAGGTATFTIGATGTGLTYQWQINGNNLTDGPSGTGSTYSGSLSNMLTISNLSESDAVTASAGIGCVVNITPSCTPTPSSVVGLTVNELPNLTVTPGTGTTVVLYGTPGSSYNVLRATNLTFNAGLYTFGPYTAPSNGQIDVMDSFSDLGAIPSAAFYQLQPNP